MMKNWGVIGGIAAALAAGIYVLWGPVTERKKRRKGLVPGLENLGNTCFMNSLLQGLAACPSFIQWLKEFTARYNTEPLQEPQHPYLSVTLLKLLEALCNQEEGEDDVLDAGYLLEVLRSYRWQISSFEEQDAHELFHVLTSSLEDEKDQQSRVTNLFDVLSLENQPEVDQKKLRCRSRGPLHPLPKHWKSQHPFHGRLTSIMVCKCCEQQCPVRYDTFDSLSLSIPAAIWGRPVTLDQCLLHFISSETIKDVVCENCSKEEEKLHEQITEKRRATFIKQLKLGKLPQCLCIHLQRLSWSNQGTPLKRHEHVQFSEYLSLDRYKYRASSRRSNQCRLNSKGSSESLFEEKDCTAMKITVLDQPNDLKPLLLNGAGPSAILSSPFATSPLPFVSDFSSSVYLFRLMAVVVHHGDMHSGHFVTYRRSPQSSKNHVTSNMQWLWISDDSVRKASLQEVLSSNAYLLFYERIRATQHSLS
ncbi:ubiquitin carboxyl-terminal hydrolase 30 isoform X2 [Protopterus annectens]|nr:ubiquitin carboxyl-terminal hydrolase 30 isoform X2 [Protopterus annectens]